jgi:hypothetical protein
MKRFLLSGFAAYVFVYVLLGALFFYRIDSVARRLATLSLYSLLLGVPLVAISAVVSMVVKGLSKRGQVFVDRASIGALAAASGALGVMFGSGAREKFLSLLAVAAVGGLWVLLLDRLRPH